MNNADGAIDQFLAGSGIRLAEHETLVGPSLRDHLCDTGISVTSYGGEAVTLVPERDNARKVLGQNVESLGPRA